MAQLVPNRFLFRFEFPLCYCAKRPAMDGRAADWDAAFLLPALHRLDDAPPVGSVYAAWNEVGLFVACAVTGKSRLPRCDREKFWKSDHLRLMTDMRDSRTVRRATRFCQQWYFMPMGGATRQEPTAGTSAVHRATDRAPDVDERAIEVGSVVSREGWALTAHLPASVLSGFDPAESPRIGLYYSLEDHERGAQALTIGDELNWWIDPSSWATAELSKAETPKAKTPK